MSEVFLSKSIIGLAERIRNKMAQEGYNAHALEKRAGLKSNAIHNIICGRSKNPSINVIVTIARNLNCSVLELIDDNVGNEHDSFEIDDEEVGCSKFDDKELYVVCATYLCSLLKRRQCWLDKNKLIHCVDEIYMYSRKRGIKRVDSNFAKWLIEKMNV